MSDTPKITVRLLAAQLQNGGPMFGTQDPYVVVKCGDAVFKSAVHAQGGQSPKWNDTATFRVASDVLTLKLSVKDRQAYKWDAHIGSVVVQLNQVFAKGVVHRWFDLRDKETVIGKILVQIEKVGSVTPKSITPRLSKVRSLSQIKEDNPMTLLRNSYSFMISPEEKKDKKNWDSRTSNGVPEGAWELAFGQGAFKRHKSVHNIKVDDIEGTNKNKDLKKDVPEMNPEERIKKNMIMTQMLMSLNLISPYMKDLALKAQMK